MAEDEEGVAVSEHCLLSAEDTSPLLSPIQSAPRIKVSQLSGKIGMQLCLSLQLVPVQYACVATSEHYIALGANTGGVYCFHRQGYRYIRILANQVRLARGRLCT